MIVSNMTPGNNYLLHCNFNNPTLTYITGKFVERAGEELCFTDVFVLGFAADEQTNDLMIKAFAPLSPFDEDAEGEYSFLRDQIISVVETPEFVTDTIRREQSGIEVANNVPKKNGMVQDISEHLKK